MNVGSVAVRSLSQSETFGFVKADYQTKAAAQIEIWNAVTPCSIVKNPCSKLARMHVQVFCNSIGEIKNRGIMRLDQPRPRNRRVVNSSLDVALNICATCGANVGHEKMT